MSKYRSRETPIPGSSVSETHPGYWADHIGLEKKIIAKWHKDYGHKYYDQKNEPVLSSWRKPELCQRHMPKHPPDSQVPCNKPVSYLKPCIKNVDHSDLTGHGNIEKGLGTSRTAGLFTPGFTSSYPQKMAYVYPTPGNTQQHNPVKDPVTSYSSSFGHHSFRARLQNASSPANVSYMQNSKCPYAKQEFHGVSADPDIVCYTPQSYNDSLLAHRNDSCSLDPFSGGKSDNFPDLASGTEHCPKCLRVLCCCVPRRRQKVPEEEETGPETVLPPWPPQIWCGPTYSGNRYKTEGDTVRLRYKLSRDPDLKTPMNRMFDEMQHVNYFDKKCVHSGSNSHSCPICRQEYKAERGSWFHEQVKEGNLFTTGDTQFMSSAFATKIRDPP